MLARFTDESCPTSTEGSGIQALEAELAAHWMALFVFHTRELHALAGLVVGDEVGELAQPGSPQTACFIDKSKLSRVFGNFSESLMVRLLKALGGRR
jgi:hypothetical protein